MQQLIISFSNLLDLLLKLAAGVAFLVFLWGITVFVFKSGDPKSHTEGKNKMIWGIISLFVMFSVWAIVRVIQADLLGGPSQVIHDTMNGSNA